MDKYRGGCHQYVINSCSPTKMFTILSDKSIKLTVLSIIEALQGIDFYKVAKL